MTELEQFIEMKRTQKRPVTESTIQQYTRCYNTIRDHLGGRDISDEFVTDEVLVNVIDSFKITPAGKLNFQNVAVMIKAQHKQPTEKLLKFKELLTAKKDLDTEYKSIQKLTSLPTHSEVRKYIDDLYQQADYSKYLINELIFSYGLRNADVNLVIIPLAEYKELKKNDKEKYESENWLVLKKNDCDLVINRYKTKGSYGTKIISIKLKKVVDAGNKLGSGNLIQNSKTDKVNDNTLHNNIHLYDLGGVKLRQSDYFKINIMHLQSQPNSLHKIHLLGKSRGTQSLDTLDKHYNMHPKDEDS